VGLEGSGSRKVSMADLFYQALLAHKEDGNNQALDPANGTRFGQMSPRGDPSVP
jgi:hypothetical protein